MTTSEFYRMREVRARVRLVFPDARLWTYDPRARRYFVTNGLSLDSGVLLGSKENCYTPLQAWQAAEYLLLAYTDRLSRVSPESVQDGHREEVNDGDGKGQHVAV